MMKFLFFIPWVLTYLYITSISSTANNKRYKKRILVSLISIVLGIIFEFLLNEKMRFSYIILGFLPIIHLFFYRILSIVFKPFIGQYPYMPYREKIGAKVLGYGYPNDRKVKLADYFFSITLLLLPISVIVLLSYLVNSLFK